VEIAFWLSLSLPSETTLVAKLLFETLLSFSLQRKSRNLKREKERKK